MDSASTRRLLTGAARYVDDVNLPGQLHLSVVRSSVAHAEVVGISVVDALSAPGVHAVLTAADLDHVPHLPVRVSPFPNIEARMPPVIARDVVRFVGQPIAAVVADDPYVAEDAAELVQVELAERVPVLDAATSDDELFSYLAADGDVDNAFADAEVVIEEDFSIQRQTAVPLETRGLLARWSDDRLELWGPTKYIQFARDTMASLFGLDRRQVVCHRIDVGGMFGVRGELYPEDFLVPWAARVVGRPVKWIEDRREHLMAINHSREQSHRLRLAVSADGDLLAFTDEFAMDMGAFANAIGGRLAQLTVESLPGPYRWRAHRIRCRGLATNKTPVGVMRGPSTFEATFVRERALDLAAARLGIEGLELRRRNLLTPAELPHVVRLGPDMEDSEYDSGDYPRLLEAVTQFGRWGELRREMADRRAAGECVGTGLALFVNHSGYGLEETVELDLTTEGRFIIRTSGAEVGQGLERMARLVACETLGVPEDIVDVRSSASDAHDGGAGTFSSRSTMFVGSAVADACAALLRDATARAATLAGRAVEAFEATAKGVRDTEGTWHWKDLAPLSALGRHEAREPTFGFGAHLALVRVDPDTGGVALERLIVAYDCGRAIDRSSAEAQLIGATAQAAGETLLEEIRFDENGQPLSTTFMDYLLPSSADVPRIDAVLLELARSPRNPLGVKGVGEAGIYGVPAAIANAVADALGRSARLTSLPLCPEKLICGRR